MTGIYGIDYYNNYSLTGNYGYGYSTGAVSSARSEEKGMIVNPGKSDVEKPGRKSSPAECETCKNRKYQDGSDEMVSFKSASHISPQASASRVRAHEQEHVTNAYNKLHRTTVKFSPPQYPCGPRYVPNAALSTPPAVPPRLRSATVTRAILISRTENPPMLPQ